MGNALSSYTLVSSAIHPQVTGSAAAWSATLSNSHLPSSLQQHPHILCHTTVNHINGHSLPKQHFSLVSGRTSLQREFLLQQAPAEPSDSFSSLHTKNRQVNRGQMLLFPS